MCEDECIIGSAADKLEGVRYASLLEGMILAFHCLCGEMDFKSMRRHLLYLIFLALGQLYLFACAQSPQEFGILKGHVTIGPLVPVLREGELDPTPAPEVYAAREVVLFERDGKTEFVHLRIDSNGDYRAELPVGIYVVDINHVGIDIAADLPKEVEITHQGVTRLDIDIDTGIR
ncbi:MAG: hypothetical protein A2Z14_18290 [Chloroflexi bacterium RBG_16_48_8]|nr:MAG: hypothetical protein A2Z14_18290 [Chloroflexi bacterium RBG_16_48_8]